jgi:hypothetical protein
MNCLLEFLFSGIGMGLTWVVFLFAAGSFVFFAALTLGNRI